MVISILIHRNSLEWAGNAVKLLCILVQARSLREAVEVQNRLLYKQPCETEAFQSMTF